MPCLLPLTIRRTGGFVNEDRVPDEGPARRMAEESRGRRHFQKMPGGVILASRMPPGSCTAADCTAADCTEAVLHEAALGAEKRRPPETCSSDSSSSACIPFRWVLLSFILTSLCRGNVRLRPSVFSVCLLPDGRRRVFSLTGIHTCKGRPMLQERNACYRKRDAAGQTQRICKCAERGRLPLPREIDIMKVMVLNRKIGAERGL